MKQKRSHKKGFTLAELLIVVAILGVLAAIAIPVFSGSLDKAGRSVDVANARSLKALLVTGYLDGTVQFSSSQYGGDPTALVVYAERDKETAYFASGDILVNGKSYTDDGGIPFKRIRDLVSGAGLDGITVHAKNTDGTGWDYCAVILYSDGTVRIVGNPGSLGLPASGINFESILNANLPAPGESKLEKYLAGESG